MVHGLRRFDADPVFCRILDAGRGGFWSIRPIGGRAADEAAPSLAPTRFGLECLTRHAAALERLT